MACKRSAVRSRLAPPIQVIEVSACFNPFLRLNWRQNLKLVFDVSSPHRLDGLGHRVFIPATGVRIPLGTPNKIARFLRAFLFVVSKGLAERLRFDQIAGSDLEYRSVARIAPQG